MDDTIEAIFNRFKCFDRINAEYERRAMIQCQTCEQQPRAQYFQSVLRSQSIFCVYSDNIDGIYHIRIRVEKYNGTLNCFENVADLTVERMYDFEIVLHMNKILVMGGIDRARRYSKSVSLSVITMEKSRAAKDYI